MKSELVLENLSCIVGGTRVFEDLSFRAWLPAGLTLVLGRNAAGKTTLLRLLAGDLTPCSGSVSMQPEPRFVQFVATDPLLLPHRTNGENTRFFSNIRYWRERFNESVRSTCARGFGVEDILEESGASSGDSRALEVVRALAATPELLLLDEPFAVWDVNRRRGAFEFLAKHCEKFGVTCLVASHLPSEAWPYAAGALFLTRTNGETSLTWEGPDELPASIADFFGLRSNFIGVAEDE